MNKDDRDSAMVTKTTRPEVATMISDLHIIFADLQLPSLRHIFFRFAPPALNNSPIDVNRLMLCTLPLGIRDSSWQAVFNSIVNTGSQPTVRLENGQPEQLEPKV